MLKRINDALPGLVGGILLYGVIVQLAGVWFVEDKPGYCVGLWYGIAIAVGLSINIATVIYDSMTGEGADVARRVAAKSVLRYAVVAVLLLLFGYLRLGNLFTLFLGLLGLKVSAYAQPLLAKLGVVAPTEYAGDLTEDTQGNNLPGRSDAASGDKINKITDKEVIQ